MATKLISVQFPSAGGQCGTRAYGPADAGGSQCRVAQHLAGHPVSPEGRRTSREERRFALPDGGEGMIVTELERLPAEGLNTMGQAERRVVTQVAGTRRITREQWSLERIGG